MNKGMGTWFGKHDSAQKFSTVQEFLRLSRLNSGFPLNDGGNDRKEAGVTRGL